MSPLKDTKAEAEKSSPDARLFQIAVLAWSKWPAANAAPERREYFSDALASDMTCALIRQWQPGTMAQAIGWYLNKVSQEIRSQAPKVAVAVYTRATPNTAMAAKIGSYVESYRDAVSAQVGQRSAPANPWLSPTASLPAAPKVTAEMAEKHKKRTAATADIEVKWSMLDRFMVGMKRIGDCTVGEVRKWTEDRRNDAAIAGRDARFASMLTANLPSGEVIRNMWKDTKEVDALYAKAGAEFDVAA